MTVATTPRLAEGMRSTSRAARSVAVLAGVFGVALIASGIAGLFEDEPGTRMQRLTWMALVPLGLGITYTVLAGMAWRHGSERPRRWAWVAGAFVFVGFFAAVSALIRVSVMTGLDPFTSDAGNLWTGITMSSVLLAAPIVATFELIRAKRTR
jgi:cytochrome bd-type quinol oxidase subunit 2